MKSAPSWAKKKVSPFVVLVPSKISWDFTGFHGDLMVIYRDLMGLNGHLHSDSMKPHRDFMAFIRIYDGIPYPLVICYS